MGGIALPRRRLSDDEINQLVPPGLSESDIGALVPPTADEQATAAQVFDQPRPSLRLPPGFQPYPIQAQPADASRVNRTPPSIPAVRAVSPAELYRQQEADKVAARHRAQGTDVAGRRFLDAAEIAASDVVGTAATLPGLIPGLPGGPRPFDTDHQFAARARSALGFDRPAQRIAEREALVRSGRLELPDLPGVGDPAAFAGQLLPALPLFGLAGKVAGLAAGPIEEAVAGALARRGILASSVAGRAASAGFGAAETFGTLRGGSALAAGLHEASQTGELPRGLAAAVNVALSPPHAAELVLSAVGGLGRGAAQGPVEGPRVAPPEADLTGAPYGPSRGEVAAAPRVTPPPPADYGTGALRDRRMAAGLPEPTAEGFDPALWRRANDPRPVFRRTQAAPTGPGSLDIYHREQGGKPVPLSAAPELASAQSSVSRDTPPLTAPAAPERPVVARSAGGPSLALDPEAGGGSTVLNVAELGSSPVGGVIAPLAVGGVAGSVAAAQTTGDTRKKLLVGAGVGLLAAGTLAGGARLAREARAADGELPRGAEVGATSVGPSPGTAPQDPFAGKPFIDAGASKASEIDVQAFFRDPQYANTVLKAGLDAPSAARLANQLIESAVETGHYPKQAIGWDQARKTFAELGWQGNPTQPMFDQARVLGARDTYTANVKLQLALEKTRFDPALQHTTEEAVMLDRAVAGMEATNRDLIGRFLKSGSALGRALQAHQAMAKETLDPLIWRARAQTALGDQPFTDQHRATLQRLIDHQDRQGLAQFVTSMEGQRVPDQLVSLWKAGLLTGLPTQVANLTGNVTMAMLETAKDAPALLADHLLRATVSAFYPGLGRRTKAVNLEAQARGIGRAFRTGAAGAQAALGEYAPAVGGFFGAQLGAGLGYLTGPQEHKGASTLVGAALGVGLGAFGGRAVRAGFRGNLPAGRPADLSKYDAKSTHFDNAILDTYVNIPFAALTAGDQFFRPFGIQRSLAEQATVRARAEDLTGDALRQRVWQLMAAPTSEMSLEAAATAEYALFQNQGVLSAIGQGIKTGGNAKLAPAVAQLRTGLAETVLPFTKTPANVATRVVEYSPFGYLRTVANTVSLFKALKEQRLAELTARKGGPGTVDALAQEIELGRKAYARQKLAADSFGRATIGTAPILLGYWLAADGLMTGSRPTSGSEADEWDLEGKQENAVKLGGQWRSVQRISPLGNLMALGANLYHAAANPGATALGAAAAGASSIGKTVSEQSFLTGLTSLSEAIKAPEDKAAAFVRGQVGSLVPNVVRRTATLLDTDAAGNPISRKAESVGGELVARLPGVSRTQPARLDQFGLPKRGSPGAFSAFVDPTSPKRDRTLEDPVIAELQRVGATIGRLKQRPGESALDFRARQKQVGPQLQGALTQLISRTDYQALDPEDRQSALEGVTARLRTAQTAAQKRGEQLDARDIQDIIARELAPRRGARAPGLSEAQIDRMLNQP